MAVTSRPKPLLIGRLAERTGVNIETIRYYERIGLLLPASRTAGGHRAYDEQHFLRLRFVRRCRELGFSLSDIRALIELAERSNLACAQVKDMAIRHLDDVRGKIASLKKLERALTSMTKACNPGTNEHCPIFQVLRSD